MGPLRASSQGYRRRSQRKTRRKHPRLTYSTLTAGGLAGLASAANREDALEPFLVGLISGLLLFPAVFWLPVLLAPRDLQGTEYDFPRRACAFLWLKLNRFGVIGHADAKSVPGDRRSGRRCTTVAQRTAICERQGGKKQRNTFRNHRDL